MEVAYFTVYQKQTNIMLADTWRMEDYRKSQLFVGIQDRRSVYALKVNLTRWRGAQGII